MRKILIAAVLTIGCAAWGQSCPSGAVPIQGGGTCATTARGANANFFQPVNVKAYGAVANGSTDDGPAIRSAMAVGADVYFPCSSTPYYVNSFAGNYSNNSWVFEPLSNETIYSDSPGCATIQMGAGLVNSGGQLYGGGMFLLNGLSNVTIKNITIDMNGLNNLVPSGGAIRNAIAIKGVGSSNITLSYDAINNSSGQNAVSFDAASSYITMDHISTLWSGTALAGNTYQADWSALYSEADHTTISYPTIVNSVGTYPRGPSGGVELHGNYSILDDGDFQYALPMVYVNPITSMGSQTQVHITNNHCLHCYVGLIAVQGNISNLEFGGNDIDLAPVGWGTAGSTYFLAHGVLEEPTYGAALTNTDIHDNRFTEADGGSATGEDTIGVEINTFNKSHIHHNLMQGLAGPCFDITPPSTGMLAVQIDHNPCIDFGNNTTSAGQWGFILNSASGASINGLAITNNPISLSSYAAGAQAFDFNWTAPVLGTVAISQNQITNVGIGQGGPEAESYDSSIVGYDPLQWNPLTYIYISTSDTLGLSGSGFVENDLLYSSVFSNAAWTSINLTLTPNAAPDPNGVSDAMQVQSTSSGHFLFQQLNPISAGTYTFSMYAKNNGGVQQLYYAVYCNTTSSYIVVQTNFGPQLSSAWQRLSGPFVVPAGCTSVNVYAFYNEFTAAVNAFAWGAQVNPGGLATALIQTNGTAILSPHAVSSQAGFFHQLYIDGSPLATSNLSDWTNSGVANGDIPVWDSVTGKWTATTENPSASVTTPTVNTAACIKAVGPPIVIGYCSTALTGTPPTCICN
jgi:hypothetical protein